MSEPAIILTRELIEACRSDRGGFTGNTIRALGAAWPPTKGWTHDLIGKKIPAADYAKAIAMRNKKPHPPGEPWFQRSPGQTTLD